MILSREARPTCKNYRASTDYLGTGGISDVEVNPLNYVIVLNGCVDTKTYLRLTIPLLLSSLKKIIVKWVVVGC